MFVRRAHGLFEFTMASLCLWAAWHHTPVGAAVRHLSASLFGVRSEAKSLLAYYSGTASRRSDRVLAFSEVVPPSTQDLALATALHASLRHLPAHRRAPALEFARAHSLAGEDLFDEHRGPAMARALLLAASPTSGGEEGAVLAAFVGREVARYAAERGRAEGIAVPTIDDLARQLPPGFEEELIAAREALAFGVAFGLGWPVPAGSPISSGFGMREHPVLGGARPHEGVDLPLPIGTPVQAVADGRVRRASDDAVNGRMLVLDHGRGVTTAYLHNQVLLVREGESVRRGQVISRSGNTGRSTGPHLHYQLEIAGTPVDPVPFRPRTADSPP